MKENEEKEAREAARKSAGGMEGNLNAESVQRLSALL